MTRLRVTKRRCPDPTLRGRRLVPAKHVHMIVAPSRPDLEGTATQLSARNEATLSQCSDPTLRGRRHGVISANSSGEKSSDPTLRGRRPSSFLIRGCMRRKSRPDLEGTANSAVIGSEIWWVNCPDPTLRGWRRLSHTLCNALPLRPDPTLRGRRQIQLR